MSDFEEFIVFFDCMGVSYGVWSGDDDVKRITVAQAHFEFNEKGKFIQVVDDEMGGVFPRKEDA